MDESEYQKKKVIIVGAGLVGSLQALYFGQRSYNVNVYEYRPDPRNQNYVAGRSINLALSKRGREALKAVGAEEHVVKTGIPMYARMIHSYEGKQKAIPYGKKDEYILSIDRRELNKHLISLVEKEPNVNFYFETKCVEAKIKEAKVTFQTSNNNEEELTDNADLVVGCDGSFSGIRKKLMKLNRMDYSQVYIPHGYKEVEMPATQDGNFAMAKNYLHIWPRGTFMMIALPNQNKTFTCTLFMPYAIFDSIQTEEDIIAFFEREFPDSIPLIGREKIISDYKKNPVGDLISVKCSPYHYEDKCVIVGDAAHAMVPFYGQGMNCGFEDCLVMHTILDKHHGDLAKALEEYSVTRNPDAEAIIDLAMYNYLEMRDHVNSRLFVLRKHFDNFLYWLFPNSWIPLYTMTTFTRIPYHEVIERSKKQDKIVRWLVSAFGVFGVAAVSALCYKNLSSITLPSIEFLRDKEQFKLFSFIGNRDC